jgi:hypothetical protein
VRIFQNQLDEICARNQQALDRCRQTALYTFWVLRPFMYRDVACMIAKQVWETRGGREWLREEK